MTCERARNGCPKPWNCIEKEISKRKILKRKSLSLMVQIDRAAQPLRSQSLDLHDVAEITARQTTPLSNSAESL